MYTTPIDQIRDQVKKVIEYSQNIPDCEIDPIIDKWFEAKQDFIELFGSTIYEVPGTITAYLDPEQQEKKFNKLLDNLYYKYKMYPNLINFFGTINYKDFFNNIVINNYTFNNAAINKNKTGEIVIPSGMKITKAIKFLVKDKEIVDDIQTMMSMVIQENKITGQLCFSVHPLDYLSSSENTYNWRSCHALDGEYCAGNLSYMLDKSTVICYLKGENTAHLPRFPHDIEWNNKKWRMLLFLSDDWKSMIAGRQYPFFSKSLLDQVKTEWAKINSQLYENAHTITTYIGEDYSHVVPLSFNCYKLIWSEWHNDRLTSVTFENSAENFPLKKAYFPIAGDLYSPKRLITDVSDLHFNDILHSSVYTPYYAWQYPTYGNYEYTKQHYTIGAEVPCPKCGYKKLYYHGSMLCKDCEKQEDRVQCDCCGRMIYIDDAIYTHYETYVCESCYEDEYKTCDECGDVFHIDDMCQDRSGSWYCRGCMEFREE